MFLIIILLLQKILHYLIIEFQLDNKAIGIIKVVNNTKYIDKPSTPK